MEFPEFKDPSGSIFSPIRLEKEAVAENADDADNETNKLPVMYVAKHSEERTNASIARRFVIKLLCL